MIGGNMSSPIQLEKTLSVDGLNQALKGLSEPIASIIQEISSREGTLSSELTQAITTLTLINKKLGLLISAISSAASEDSTNVMTALPVRAAARALQESSTSLESLSKVFDQGGESSIAESLYLISLDISALLTTKEEESLLTKEAPKAPSKLAIPKGMEKLKPKKVANSFSLADTQTEHSMKDQSHGQWFAALYHSLSSCSFTKRQAEDLLSNNGLAGEHGIVANFWSVLENSGIIVRHSSSKARLIVYEFTDKAQKIFEEGMKIKK